MPKCLSEIDVVIVAGGSGTRLRPVFADLPKVMAPVNGKPFLGYLLCQLRGFGARRVTLALGYLSKAVQEYVNSYSGNGMRISAHVEPEPRGTGGAVREVLPFVESKYALIMNGDAFTKADLCLLVGFHRSRQARISILATFLSNVGRFGLVETDEDGMVSAFREKPDSAGVGGYVNAGVYVFDRTAIEGIPADRPVSLETEVFPKLCGRGLYALKGDFPFIDIGTPESYAAAGNFFSKATDDN